MKTKTMYETIDGKSFEDKDEAVKHELFLIKELLHDHLFDIDCSDCPFEKACKIANCEICHLVQ